MGRVKKQKGIIKAMSIKECTPLQLGGEEGLKISEKSLLRERGLRGGGGGGGGGGGRSSNFEVKIKTP